VPGRSGPRGTGAPDGLAYADRGTRNGGTGLLANRLNHVARGGGDPSGSDGGGLRACSRSTEDSGPYR